MEIRLLCDHREAHRSASVTRLDDRAAVNLVHPRPRAGGQHPVHARWTSPDSSTGSPARLRDHDALSPSPRSPRSKSAGSASSRAQRATLLKRELHDPRRPRTAPSCSPRHGCGTITAAILIGQTAGAERFPTDAHFARMAGVAPIPVSSGRQRPPPPAPRRQPPASTARSTSSRSHADAGTPPHAPTSNESKSKARPAWRPSDASSAYSHAASTASCNRHRNPAQPDQRSSSMPQFPYPA